MEAGPQRVRRSWARATRGPLTALVIAVFAWGADRPTTAWADAGPKFPEKAIYILPGLTFGGTSSLDVGTGGHLGGEVSAVYWLHGFYFGAMVDGLYDWKRDGGRFSFGAEAGWGPFGVDGGYLLELAEDGPYHGATVRFFVSLSVVALYVRYGGVRERPDFIEWGFMLKAPLPLWSKYRLHPRPKPRPLPKRLPPTDPARPRPGTKPPAATPPASAPATSPGPGGVTFEER